MMRLVAALESNLAPDLAGQVHGEMQATMNIGTIIGGAFANVMPGRCTLEIDRRLLPSETVTGAVAEITAALAEVVDAFHIHCAAMGKLMDLAR